MVTAIYEGVEYVCATTETTIDTDIEEIPDVYSYNPFSRTGGQPYQALAVNYMVVDVPDPNA